MFVGSRAGEPKPKKLWIIGLEPGDIFSISLLFIRDRKTFVMIAETTLSVVNKGPCL